MSTHLRLLFGSISSANFALAHFQVGSAGRSESRMRRLLRFVSSPFALMATILMRGADIVHINTSLNRGAYWRDVVYLLCARACGARVVYQVHGGSLPQQFFAGRRALIAFLRWSLRLPDAVVVLARSEEEAYSRFVPGQHVVLLPNGIDVGAYSSFRHRRWHAGEPLRLLYFGRLARDKGPFEAVQGLCMARARGVCARMIVAGSGPDEIALRNAVRDMGLADSVSFVGSVLGEDKLTLFAQADVLVFPTYAEGLPYALLEGMAAGMAVITTRVGAIPDVVVDGVHGLFVEVRDPQGICDAIARLAADRELLARLGSACLLRIASGYSVERLAGAVSRLYSEMCAAKRSSAVSRS